MKGLLIREIKNYMPMGKFVTIMYVLIYIFDYMSVLAGSDSAFVTFGVALISFYMSTFAFAFESNNKHGQCFICLPYSRTQLVLAKYICAFSVPFFLVLLDFVFFGMQISFFSVIVTVPLLLSMPVYYCLRGGKKGLSNSQAVSLVSTLLLAGAEYIFREKLSDAYILNQGSLFFLVALALLWFGSLMLSAYFYKRCDI